MTGAVANPVPARVSNRSRLARSRAAEAMSVLARCRLCAHDCRVNRLAGPGGLCHASSVPGVFSAQIEVSDELELIPCFAIALGGCDLRCSFCITGADSWNPRSGEPLDVSTMAEKARAALAKGARTVMILGGEPTIHLPAALEIVAALPEDARLIWKTNAHGSARARALLDGIFDVWLADYKFGNDACAYRLARVANYTRVVQENLLWANERSDLIVRHLVMPGHVHCCWAPVAGWLAENLPGVKVNLRSGFWPAWRARQHPEFVRLVSTRESRLAADIAREFELNLIE